MIYEGVWAIYFQLGFVAVSNQKVIMALSLISLLSLAALGAGAPQAPNLPRQTNSTDGFVTVDGDDFLLGGQPFIFAGSNAYYFPFSGTQEDVEKGMTAAQDAGLKVFRTWGFNDKNATYDAAGLPQYGSGTEVTFQTFAADGTISIDVTPFDKVVNAASKTGIKLIVTLTNNWADYGGMDVYTVNLGGQYHDDVR